MLQNLASYLSSVLSGETTAEGVEDSSINFKTTEENEWILVERNSECNSETGSVKSLDETEYDMDAMKLYPVSLTRSNSTSSLPSTTNMEDSWFVTPPPCFTSTGPIHMRTSPLENLLIEHPSMSVYHIHPSRRHFSVRSVRSSSNVSRGSSEGEVEVEEIENIRGEQVAVVETRLPRLNRLPFLEQQQKQLVKSDRAQKAQIQKACIGIKRGNLQRHNKAREVNSRNHRQRRGERSQGATRSCANNNRKC